MLTDFSYAYMNFTVSYRDALDRLRVQLNSEYYIVFLLKFS